jgi:uncharacterized phage protein (TIGR02220 family)
MDHAGDGDITEFSAEDIADGCLYEGEPNNLTLALESSGFIDVFDDKRVLWRWDEIGGKLLISREKSKERVYKSRGKKKAIPDPVAEVLRATNANVTPVLRGIELDLDLDLEKEKEKDLKDLKESVENATPPPPKKPKKEAEYIPAQEVIDYMNQVSGKRLQLTDEAKKLITDRWKQHRNFEAFKHVIDVRWSEVQRRPESKKWFNGITPFRPENFAMSLSMEIEEVTAEARRKGTGNKPFIQGITPAAATAKSQSSDNKMTPEEMEAARAMARKLDERFNNGGK